MGLIVTGTIPLKFRTNISFPSKRFLYRAWRRQRTSLSFTLRLLNFKKVLQDYIKYTILRVEEGSLEQDDISNGLELLQLHGSGVISLM